MVKTAAQRQRDSRQRKRDKDVTKNVTSHKPEPEGVTFSAPRTLSAENEAKLQLLVNTTEPTEGNIALAHYYTSPEAYVTRTNPDRLNWGPWMNSDALNEAGLKANRVPIPGDWDYEGVAV